MERPNVGYVTTVDAGVHARVKLRSDNTIVLDVPQFDQRISGSIDPSSCRVLMNEPAELHLVKTALQIALMYAHATGHALSGLSLRTENDGALAYVISENRLKIAKAGLGSSAAVTVATISAVLKAFGVGVEENDALHKLSQLAHAVATGKVGSGFDIAAATHGDIIYSRYSPEIVRSFPAEYVGEDVRAITERSWDYSIEHLPLPRAFDFLMASFSGNAAITTSMARSAGQFKQEQPERYSQAVGEMNKENELSISHLRKISRGDISEGTLSDFKEAFDRARLATKRFGEMSGVGIEPDDATSLIEESKKNGAFVAKLPGAGGYDSIAALVRNHAGTSDTERLKNFWSSSSSLQLLGVARHDGGAEVYVRRKLRG
ncbi:MAG: hypothetical protein M1286_03090 [Candidatus Marsarchaeota archaeon]|nr:hypothetical protein [Candidatus Marsarchaeota archaeon]